MITELRTRSGKVYKVHECEPYTSIKDHDTVFVVETKFGTKIRIFVDAVESFEYSENSIK